MSKFQKLMNKVANRVSRDDSLVKEYSNTEKDKVCCVCYEGVADQLLQCGHKLCQDCYPKLNKCPICRFQYKTPFKLITYYTLMDPPLEMSPHDPYTNLDWEGRGLGYDEGKYYKGWNDRLDAILLLLEEKGLSLSREFVVVFCNAISTMVDTHLYTRARDLNADSDILILTFNKGDFVKDDFMHITNNDSEYETLRSKTCKIRNLIKDYFNQRPECAFWYNPLT